jgi:tRNA (cmo5U34)-methyltransferase
LARAAARIKNGFAAAAAARPGFVREIHRFPRLRFGNSRALTFAAAMSPSDPHAPPVAFDHAHAATYDQRFAKLAPMRDALHLLIGAILADLPAEARILCVGAGTGQELMYLARKFPRWRFAVVEPSAPMLEVCRRKADECGIASRCDFHGGFLESLPPAEAFDAATSLLVSQFILAPDARAGFFRAIAGRLRPGGYLASADLASDTGSAAYRSLLDVWIRLMRETGSPPEQLERLRVTYGRDVAVLPAAQIESIIASAGFGTPVPFLQTGLIHAWYAQRTG